MKNVVFVTLIFFSTQLFSQKITISGFVQDDKSGEKLIGANVYDLNSLKGTITNNFGFYSLTLPATDSVKIIFSFIGYQTQKKDLALKKDFSLNIYLHAGNLLHEVVVTDQRIKPIEQRDEMSIVSIPMKQIKTLSSLGGETDIMKALQLMPGVQSGNEGTSDLYVRGGSPDQNLILLDDVSLYYINHLGGFVSTFNTDALNSVKLIKGGFPARYGSRLSSVLDIRMKEGNMKKFHGQGTMGLVSSKISLEGPVKKDTSSYIISFRRFLYDIFSRPISKMAFNGVSVGYNFYDFNAKINYKLSDKNRLYLSFYLGDDKFITKFKDKSKENVAKNALKWGNILGALRWNHLYNRKLFSNITLSYTRYKYLTEFSYKDKSNQDNMESYNNFYSGINDINAKFDFEYYIIPRYKIKFGINNIYHTFQPGTINYKQSGIQLSTNIDTSFGNYSINAFENSAYLENEISISNKFNSNIGIRTSNYIVNKKNFYSIEPRILFSYIITENMSIKLSYSEMQQYVHLLTSSSVGMPIDLWVPATKKVVPEKSQQIAFGISKSLKNFKYELSVESYYKKMHNMIAYKEGSSYFGTSQDWQDKVETNGNGESLGIEFLLQKKEGKTTGWISYTLSKTTRRFNNINNGKTYPYKYDHRHDISIVFNHKLKDNIDISATWVFSTGSPITLAIGKYYMIDDNDNDNPAFIYEEADIYGSKNSFRMHSYHRLDVCIIFYKKKKWGERTWSISVYNVYNRQNPYYYYFDYDYDNDGNQIGNDLKLYQQSLFPIIPSVSYSFKF
ncbi:MAG: TonB-dependent receptor [Bacteroidetes bacterium]|nr:MAG: TonB-dependent receptor [Bacteroidota bacterium]